jgi:hypothetical protein
MRLKRRNGSGVEWNYSPCACIAFRLAHREGLVGSTCSGGFVVTPYPRDPCSKFSAKAARTCGVPKLMATSSIRDFSSVP